MQRWGGQERALSGGEGASALVELATERGGGNSLSRGLEAGVARLLEQAFAGKAHNVSTGSQGHHAGLCGLL